MLRMRAIILFLLFCVSFSQAQAEVSIQAEISRQVASLGDNLQYSIVLTSNDEPIEMGSFELSVKPTFEGLQVTSPNASRSSEQQITNLQSVETQRLTWQLTATREGLAKISAGEATYKGKRYTLAAQEVKVMRDEVQAGTIGAGIPGILNPQSGYDNLNQQLRGRLFARIMVSNPNPYLQEMVLVTCKIYFDPQLTGQIGSPSWDTPNWSDLFAQEVKQGSEPRLQSENISGRQFSSVIIKQFMLSTTRAGKIEIPLSSAQCAVRVRSTPSFEQGFFGDSFFGSSIFDRSVAVRLPIAPLKMDVKPLPTGGRPESFQNAVGTFDFAGAIDRKEMTQDDLLTLRLEIGGEGYLGSVKEPVLPNLSGWSTVGTQTKLEGPADLKAFRGKKVFEILLRPEKTGSLNIPEIPFSFFDPSGQRYVGKVAGPFSVDVKPGAARSLLVASVPTSSSTSSKLPQIYGEHIAYIHPKYPGDSSFSPLYKNPFFLTFQGVPLAAIAFAFGIRLRRRYMEQNQDAFRYRSAGSRARRELQEAQTALKNNDAPLFFRKLEESLRQYLAIKLKRSASGSTLEDIEAACATSKLDQQQTKSLRAVLERCEMGRYSSSPARAGEMESLLQESSQLLDNLDNHLR